jgi:predicted nucleic acid binding AN1-type Zn finger protein
MKITLSKLIHVNNCQICGDHTYLPEECERCKKRACLKDDCVKMIDAEFCGVSGKTDLWQQIVKAHDAST